MKPGVSDAARKDAVTLFWTAFKGKLLPVMKPESSAIAFFNQVIDPNFAISAVGDDGVLLGIAGFKTARGSFMGGDLKDLASVYGWIGGTWRGVILSLLERPLQANTLLMDGIFVAPNARGRGIGTALLSAIKDKAETLGCDEVRLDVIDTNPRARHLYERQGFAAQDTTDIWLFRHIFGFRRSTTMIHTIETSASSSE